MRAAVMAALAMACSRGVGTAALVSAEREVVHTRLVFDVATLRGVAEVTFGPSERDGATLEIGDLAIERVSVESDAAGGRLRMELPASRAQEVVRIEYRARYHELEGLSERGYTLVWPDHCGNLFPCRSNPADGSTFELELRGVPAGKTAVYPARLAEAPAYQLAWAIDELVELDLGTTRMGTRLFVWHPPGEVERARRGTMQLVGAFDWLEHTIGPYAFGPKAGSVAVRWGPGALGGMEHHPYWHVGLAALGEIETHVHEAAHGWFGGGVRLRCWEDFVLSEGTTTYLTARALEAVAPREGAAVWARYTERLAGVPGTAPVWPQSCGAVDLIQDGLFTRAPYLRGAFFYRAVALRIGAAALDRALAAFYARYRGRAASMRDMLEVIREVTGFDPAACGEAWLAAGELPVIGPC